MNLHPKILLMMLLVSISTCALCFAQTEVGQGGDAILKNGKYYLLDLVEAGIETTGAIPPNEAACAGAAVDPGNGICQWYNSSILNFQNHFSPEVKQGIYNALTNIPNLDAMAILKAMTLFDWNFVALPLVDIRDANTPIDLANYPMYQLAVRKSHTITINATIWNQMDTLNQVALITHEALYALVRPIPDLTHAGLQLQDSYSARQFNYKLYQNFPACSDNSTCSPTRSFSSPRLRDDYTDNEYTFTPYVKSFGNYGEADDFIGNTVNDQGALVGKRFLSTDAYVKLEGNLQTNFVPGAETEAIVRIKHTFFKDSAHLFCAESFTNSGTYQMKISLVRTLFTAELQTYPSLTEDSNHVAFTPSEMTFSKWYESQIGVGKDTVIINTDDQTQCEKQINDAAVQFEALMHSAPDYQKRWDDAY